MEIPLASSRLRKFYSQIAPWISLALGIVARAWSHHGIDFAPKAVALLALAWMLPLAVTRWLRAPEPGTEEPKWRLLVRTVSPVVTVLLYKNVLFFLVPIWFGSAHLGSFNIAIPIVFATMALFTCFSNTYRLQVLERPRVCVLWTAVVLFGALVPATVVIAFTSPRTAIIISAFLASALAWLVLGPRRALRSWKGLSSLARLSLPATALLRLATPLFPPVPMVCHDRAVGTGVLGRELIGQARRFPRGTRRVFAWFAVSLPSRYRQHISFQWFRDGEPVGAPFHSAVAGGRKEGYRTWTLHTAPAPGSWRVDLLTESNQLIGRSTFEID